MGREISIFTLAAVVFGGAGCALIVVDLANLTSLELGLVGVPFLIVAHAFVMRLWFGRANAEILSQMHKVFEMGRQSVGRIR